MGRSARPRYGDFQADAGGRQADSGGGVVLDVGLGCLAYNVGGFLVCGCGFFTVKKMEATGHAKEEISWWSFLAFLPLYLDREDVIEGESMENPLFAVAFLLVVLEEIRGT